MKKIILRNVSFSKNDVLSSKEAKSIAGGKGLPPIGVGGDGTPGPDYPWPYCICKDGTWEAMINGRCISNCNG